MLNDTYKQKSEEIRPFDFSSLIPFSRFNYTNFPSLNVSKLRTMDYLHTIEEYLNV